MSRKGENKKAKAISLSKAVRLKRKERVWAIKTKAGPHGKEMAMPLGIVLRDHLNLGSTLREIKAILSSGEVKIDGVVRKDYQFAIGLFDFIEIEKQKMFYRVVLDKRRRLILKKADKSSKEKICMVEHKHVTPQGIQLTTNDGRTFLGVEAKVGDSLKVQVPEGKIEKVLKEEAGAVIYITKGLHCGAIAKLKEIVPGTAKREKLVKFELGGKEYETVEENAVVVGEKDVELEELRK